MRTVVGIINHINVTNGGKVCDVWVTVRGNQEHYICYDRKLIKNIRGFLKEGHTGTLEIKDDCEIVGYW